MTTIISKADLDARFQQHFAYAKKFIELKGAKSYGPELSVNSNGLFLAIKSAYDDIERYKLYHLTNPQTQKSNCVKRAAFLCKWICKIKPLEYAEVPKDMSDIHGLLANADFAQFVSRSHIAAETGVHFQFSNRYLFELLYDLTFRELNGDALLHIFQNVFTSVGDGHEIYEPY